MLAQLLNNTFSLLIITLFFGFIWWIARLYEITYEGNVDRLPKWMQIWSKSLVMAQEPPSKTWRWVIVGLLAVLDAFYIIPFHDTPLSIRLFAAIINLAVFGACIYYCDKKMGE